MAAGAAATSSLVRPLHRLGWSSGSQPGDGDVVVLVEQQPLLLAAAPPRPVRMSTNRPAQLLAVEIEVQLTAGDAPGAGRRSRAGRPRAPVPHDHVAPAVLARRDHALEVEVLDRVVLDVDGERAAVGVERRALGHRPAHQHAVDLQAQVVVQAAGPVALHDEPVATHRCCTTLWLGRDLEVPLRAIALEAFRAPSARRHVTPPASKLKGK